MAGDLMAHAATKQTMQLWFTAQEFADAALAGLIPELPTTKQGINKRAEGENWRKYKALARMRTGREGGGGWEYHIDLLPLQDRIAYVSRFIQVKPEDLRLPLPLSGVTGLSERAEMERNARLILTLVANRFCRMSGMTLGSSDALFASIFNKGKIPDLPDWVRSTIGTISGRSLMRWRQKERDLGEDALAHDPAKSRKDTGLLETANDGQVKLFILGTIATNPAFSAKHIRTYCRDEFGDEIITRYGEVKPMPPLRTFQHFIAELRRKEHVALTKITDPDRYRSHMQLSGNNSYGFIGDRPNKLWMIDASPVDALCTDGRHSIYACIDVGTRRIVITVSKTPRASAVSLLIRKAILTWGIAAEVKTDNGSDFVAHETRRLFDSLAMNVVVCPPYTPEDKAYVERVIGTFQRDFAKQVSGYIGSSVAERKVIEGRKGFAKRLGATDQELFDVKLTAAELQSLIDEWVDLIYHRTPHSGMGNRTPNAVAAASLEPIRMVDERALDLLLMPAAGKNGIRIFGKQGIKIDHRFYGAGTILPGTEVFVRHDPNDLGRVFVFSVETGEFLTIAECPELAGVDPASFWRAQKQVQADYISERTGKITVEARKFAKGPPGIERTLRVARRDAAKEAEASANIIPLPKREEVHMTPEIAAALDAMTPRQTTPKPLSELAAQVHEGLQRDAERRAASNVVHLDPDASLTESARKYKWVLALEEQIAKGVPLDDETAGKMARFKATAEYQTIRDTHRYFGDLEAALRAAP